MAIHIDANAVPPAARPWYRHLYVQVLVAILAGVANGGTAVEDPPGIRDGGFGKMYLAYLRDPDGNKLCGFYRIPAE